MPNQKNKCQVTLVWNAFLALNWMSNQPATLRNGGSKTKKSGRHDSSLLYFGGNHDAYEVIFVLVLELPFDLHFDPGVRLEDRHGRLVVSLCTRLENKGSCY